MNKWDFFVCTFFLSLICVKRKMIYSLGYSWSGAHTAWYACFFLGWWSHRLVNNLFGRWGYRRVNTFELVTTPFIFDFGTEISCWCFLYSPLCLQVFFRLNWWSHRSSLTLARIFTLTLSLQPGVPPGFFEWIGLVLTPSFPCPMFFLGTESSEMKSTNSFFYFYFYFLSLPSPLSCLFVLSI